MSKQSLKGLVVALLATLAFAVGFIAPTSAYAETIYRGTQTIELDQDLTDVVIEENSTITINLNGHTISSSKNTTSFGDMHHAITNNGNLIINGTGTIDGGSYENSGAIFATPGSTTTLNGGLYTTSSWYTIKNLGTMVINDGATVTSNNRGSSVIDNGYYGGAGSSDCWLAGDGTNKPSLTVNGGIFNADPNDFTSIKNDDYGIVVVNGGTFTGTCAISNHYIATINDGSFTAEKNWVLQNCPCNSESDVGELTIKGGTFTYNGAASTGIFQYLNESNNFGFIKISGGTFSDDPSKYVDTDYRASDNGDGTYSVVKGGAEGEVTTDTDANTSIDEAAKEEVAEAATDTAKSLKDDAEAINTEDNTVAGLKVENAAAIAEVVNSAQEDDTIIVALEVSAKTTNETDEKIEEVKGENESASYFDIGVTMSVAVKSAQTGQTSEAVTTPVTDLGEESQIEVTVKLNKDDIAGKYVRIARVHDNVVDYLDTKVDYETGDVTFKTNKFSAYAALYRTSVTVTFDGNGGRWSDEASERLVDTGVGLTVKAPTNPTKGCYTFEGWYTEPACTNEFNFDTPIESEITLIAKWGEEVHTWDDGEETKPATCTEAGVKTYTCTVCKATKTEPIPAKGHTSDEGTVTKEATCTEDGSKLYKCTVCGAEIKTEVIKAKGHSWDEGKVTKEPTATEKGTKTYTCTVCKATKTEDIAPLGESVAMYRLYNPYTGEHFYTADAKEQAVLVEIGWKDEGIGWYAPKKSETPVYRLFNKYSDDHHYTTDLEEYKTCIANGWTGEGIGWYSDDAKSVKIYRQFNPYEVTGTHNYTSDKKENDYLVTIGWRAEGIGWYGVEKK